MLIAVRSPENKDAWKEFEAFYRIARRRGVQDAEAQDLSRPVLFAVSSAVGRWEKTTSGMRFRHGLRRVTRAGIIDALSRQPRDLGRTELQ